MVNSQKLMELAEGIKRGIRTQQAIKASAEELKRDLEKATITGKEVKRLNDRCDEIIRANDEYTIRFKRRINDLLRSLLKKANRIQ